MSQVNYKRIANNAIALYLRMIVTMVIGLYTSRIVLQMLGIYDFGIYGLVGGIASVLSIINASMAGASSRFITYELAKGDLDRLHSTFNACLRIHICIALFFIILAETVGLWFLNTQLNIPADRIYAANWVYQCSIASATLSITQIPYNAALFAHERMTIFAYIEILNSVLKLAIVFALALWDYDNRLIWYAILSLLVSIIILMSYRLYCVRHFNECRLRRSWDKKFIKPMLSFSIYDLYGNICGLSFYQGTNIILNFFYNVAINAAASIANTVSGVLQGFAFKIIMAFKPVIVKLYAVKNITEMSRVMRMATILSTLLMGASSIPLYIEMDYIIYLWLGNVPDYVVPFCRLLLIYCTIGIINAIQIQVIHATGNIKRLTFICGTINLLTLPAMYICLWWGLSPSSVYIIQVIAIFSISIVTLLLIKRLIPEFSIRIYIRSITTISLIIIITFALTYFLSTTIPSSVFKVFLLYLICFSITAICAYKWGINNSQRQWVKTKIYNIVHHKQSNNTDGTN